MAQKLLILPWWGTPGHQCSSAPPWANPRRRAHPQNPVRGQQQQQQGDQQCRPMWGTPPTQSPGCLLHTSQLGVFELVWPSGNVPTQQRPICFSFLPKANFLKVPRRKLRRCSLIFTLPVCHAFYLAMMLALREKNCCATTAGTLPVELQSHNTIISRSRKSHYNRY